jgi:ComF family protein
VSLILDFLFPKTCYGCHKPNGYLCPECQIHLKHLSINSDTQPPVEGRLSLFKYHPPINTLISELKYKFIFDVTDDLVSISTIAIKTDFPHLLSYWQQQSFTLVPIPLHWYRQNWRGFNQSHLLASKLSSRLSLNYCPDLLIRSKYTSPQVKTISKKARKSNIGNAFSLRNSLFEGERGPTAVGTGVFPHNIILFDDVYTTGSTLTSAASIFPKSCHIWYLTVAG